MSRKYTLVFILSYFNLIENKFLIRNAHNLVVHESDLPRGRGWSPFFWQILEGKYEIPVVLFEAGKGIDDAGIYLDNCANVKILNTQNNNNKNGIRLKNSDNNNLTGNEGDNDTNGAYITSSDNNTFTGNNWYSSTNGFYLSS